MGQFSRWPLHEDQKGFFDYLFALVLNIVFLALITLLLWPMGRVTLVVRLAKGYWIFWSVLIGVTIVLALVHRFFRMDLYERFNAYVISGLVVSGILQIGWSAYAAVVVRGSVVDASIWVAIVLYGVGVVSAYVASVAVGAYYTGTLYRMVNSALAVLSFILFSVWPAAGLAIYGWFFDLFCKRSPANPGARNRIAALVVCQVLTLTQRWHRDRNAVRCCANSNAAFARIRRRCTNASRRRTFCCPEHVTQHSARCAGAVRRNGLHVSTG